MAKKKKVVPKGYQNIGDKKIERRSMEIPPERPRTNSNNNSNNSNKEKK